MLPTILIVVAILFAAFLIFVAMQSSTFTLSRKASMAAPPGRVFEQVNDFHNWEAWSPWAKLDPAMKQAYSGPVQGKGANYSWIGNKNVGEGRMTIIESRPGELIQIDLEFLKPFAARNLTEFKFQPAGDETIVTWTMTGKNNFMAKAMHLVMNMDKMVGGQFDQGLAAMKAIVESPAARGYRP